MKQSVIGVILLVFLANTSSAVDINPIADMTTTPTGSETTTSYIEVCHRPAHGHPDTRGSILFDLDQYAGWNIESAILNVDVHYQSGCGLPTNFYTYAATEIWDESWTGAHLTHADHNWGTFVFSGTGWYQLDITDLVNAWLSGSIENYGLVFECIDANQAEHRFYSVNVSAPDMRPYLSLLFPEDLDVSTFAGVKSTF